MRSRALVVVALLSTPFPAHDVLAGDPASDAAGVPGGRGPGSERGDPYFRAGAGLAADDGAPYPARLDPSSGALWRTPLPPGQSSPCVFEDRIFLTTHDGDELATVALYRASGKLRWKRAITPPSSPRRATRSSRSGRAATGT